MSVFLFFILLIIIMLIIIIFDNTGSAAADKPDNKYAIKYGTKMAKAYSDLSCHKI